MRILLVSVFVVLANITVFANPNAGGFVFAHRCGGNELRPTGAHIMTVCEASLLTAQRAYKQGLLVSYYSKTTLATYFYEQTTTPVNCKQTASVTTCVKQYQNSGLVVKNQLTVGANSPADRTSVYTVETGLVKSLKAKFLGLDFQTSQLHYITPSP